MLVLIIRSNKCFSSSGPRPSSSVTAPENPLGDRFLLPAPQWEQGLKCIIQRPVVLTSSPGTFLFPTLFHRTELRALYVPGKFDPLSWIPRPASRSSKVLHVWKSTGKLFWRFQWSKSSFIQLFPWLISCSFRVPNNCLEMTVTLNYGPHKYSLLMPIFF